MQTGGANNTPPVFCVYGKRVKSLVTSPVIMRKNELLVFTINHFQLSLQQLSVQVDAVVQYHNAQTP